MTKKHLKSVIKQIDYNIYHETYDNISKKFNLNIDDIIQDIRTGTSFINDIRIDIYVGFKRNKWSKNT